MISSSDFLAADARFKKNDNLIQQGASLCADVLSMLLFLPMGMALCANNYFVN
jgi:hypothetical protein